jgi:hypothetical protein
MGFCLAAALPWPALGQLNEQRGEPVRRGNVWTETYTWTAPAREGGKLVLRADMGSVEITPGTGNQLEGRAVVRVYKGNEETARRVFDAFRLSARTIENTGVYVNAEFGGSRRHDNSMGVEFDIKLPAHFNLDLETRGGDIDLDGALQGEARLTTAGGDIHATDISGPIRVETAGGNKFAPPAAIFISEMSGAMGPLKPAAEKSKSGKWTGACARRQRAAIL